MFLCLQVLIFSLILYIHVALLVRPRAVVSEPERGWTRLQSHSCEVEPLDRSLRVVARNHFVVTPCVAISESVFDWRSKVLEQSLVAFRSKQFFSGFSSVSGKLSSSVSSPLLEEVVVFLVNGDSLAI